METCGNNQASGDTFSLSNKYMAAFLPVKKAPCVVEKKLVWQDSPANNKMGCGIEIQKLIKLM